MNSVNWLLIRRTFSVRIAVLAMVLALLLCSSADAETLAVTNVRIDTRSEAGVIESGAVVICDGVIEAVGKDVKIPEDAQVIDGGGATLTPGLIDSQSRLWLTATSQSDTSSTAALRTVDGLDPFDESYHEVVRQGVTAVAVAPADRGRLGGSVAVVAAAPTKSIFAIPSRESFEKEDAAETPDATPKKREGKPAPAVKATPEAKKAGEPEKKEPTPADKRAALLQRINAAKAKAAEDKKDEKKPEATKEKEDDSKKGDDKKDDEKSKDEKDDDEEKIEVPYSITRPPVPYTVGKQGWVLCADAAIQASLGIAATDGRSRISEFSALKKSLTDAEAYHKKWDEYRSWKAKQDKLPPDQRAKVETKKPMTMEERRAEFMKRLAAMRAQRSGATPKPEPKKEPEAKKDDKKEDSKSGDKKDDDKKKSEKDKVVPKPDFDPAKDRLRPILKGEIPLRITVTDDASLKRVLELAEIADCQLILVQASDLSADAMESVNWPIIAGPWVGQDDETTQFWSDQVKAGAKRVCIGTFGGSSTLRMQVAAAVAAGLDADAALDAVTRSAAEVLGVGDWLGQIQPGYRADLALFGGDPLDPATPVLRTMVAGETVYRSPVPTLPTDESADVVSVEEELLERLGDLSMPTEYVLASNRILRPSGKFRAGHVTVVDGMIKSVTFTPKDGEKGKDGVDDSLPVLNLGDLVLTPGLVTAHLGLSSGSDTSEPDSSYYVAANGLDFQSARVRGLVESGVLFAAVAPPSSNVLAGQVSGVRLAAADPIVDVSIADKMVVGVQARRTDRFPASMEGQFEFIRRRFAGEMDSNRMEMPAMIATKMRDEANARLDALSSGHRIAIIEAQTPAELRGSMRLIKSMNLNARLLLPTELKSIQKQVEADKVGLIIRPVRPTDPGWYLDEIAQAASAGCQIGIAASDAGSLRSTAALMVGQGVKPQRAMKMLTSEAATCAGMPTGSATIAVGQPADLVIWSGPPYKMTSRCLGVLSDGKMIDQDDRVAEDLSADATPTKVPAS